MASSNGSIRATRCTPIAGDKKPGDLTGNDIYDILISQDPDKQADLPSRFTAAGGLVWLHAYP